MTEAAKWVALKDNIKVRKAAGIKQAVSESHPEIASIAERILRLARKPLTLAVMGEFSAGKSSFINRLLGQNVLPVSILPKTATLTRLVWGDHAGVEIDYRFDEEIITKQASYKEFGELQSAAKISDPLVLQELDQIQEVRVFLDHPLLRKLQLLDTPGFNHDQSMDDKTLAVVDAADILVWLSDYTQPAKQSELERLTSLKEHDKRIWLVVNKADVHVSDSDSHAQAVETLGNHLHATGFLDFFQTNEILLISCKSKEVLWDSLFQQLIARLSERVLNTDMELSVTLIDDAWRQLEAVLENEDERQKALDARCGLLVSQTDVASIVQSKHQELWESLKPCIVALLREFKECEGWANSSELSSVVSFVMDYMRGPLEQRLNELKDAYIHKLMDFHCEHLENLKITLEAILNLLPKQRSELGRAVNTVLAQYRLQLNGDPDTGSAQIQYSLPAVERTVEMLEHLIVQFGSFDWKFTARVADSGVMSLSEVGEILTHRTYRKQQLEAALLRDFERDIERFCHEPSLLQLIRKLEALCEDVNQRLRRISEFRSG